MVPDRPILRLMGGGPLAELARALAELEAAGDADDHAGAPIHAPMLIVPRVLEPEFCRELICAYEADGAPRPP